jgi:hypothetical protein
MPCVVFTLNWYELKFDLCLRRRILPCRLHRVKKSIAARPVDGSVYRGKEEGHELGQIAFENILPRGVV